MKKFWRFSTAASSDGEINLTPMLDVVFIMLIFFIVTATFIKETGFAVSRSDTHQKPVTESESILVRIDADDVIEIDRRFVDPRALRANFERLGAESPSAPVVIVADRRSSTKALVAVMDASRQAGIENIALAQGQQ